MAVVLITGCSSGGIGYSIAAEFARRGCQVFATARNTSSMAGLLELGCKLLKLDVTSSKDIAAAVVRYRHAGSSSGVWPAACPCAMRWIDTAGAQCITAAEPSHVCLARRLCCGKPGALTYSSTMRACLQRQRCPRPLRATCAMCLMVSACVAE